MDDLILLTNKGQRLRDILLARRICDCKPTPEYAEYLSFMDNVTAEVASPEQRFLLWVRYEFRGDEYTVCEVCEAINEWDTTLLVSQLDKSETEVVS